ncbi:MAG: hypothetical protein FJ271_22885 [Planctomycetes bacterium]|nr:hypothetical protein [Planctomycetota bacterium]
MTDRDVQALLDEAMTLLKDCLDRLPDCATERDVREFVAKVAPDPVEVLDSHFGSAINGASPAAQAWQVVKSRLTAPAVDLDEIERELMEHCRTQGWHPHRRRDLGDYFRQRRERAKGGRP